MPTRLAMPQPFASGASATRATIGMTSGDSVNYPDGFPAVYSSPASEGGKYVSRGEMNAIGNMASNDLHYFKCGGLNTFDPAFAAAVGGYPKGAVLDYIVGYKLYKVISLVDANSVDYSNVGVDGVNWQWLNSNIAEVDFDKPVVIGSIENNITAAGINAMAPVGTVYASASGIVSLKLNGNYTTEEGNMNFGTVYPQRSSFTFYTLYGHVMFYKICTATELKSLTYPGFNPSSGIVSEGWSMMAAPGLSAPMRNEYVSEVWYDTGTKGVKYNTSYVISSIYPLTVPFIKQGQYITFAFQTGVSSLNMSPTLTWNNTTAPTILSITDIIGPSQELGFTMDVQVSRLA